MSRCECLRRQIGHAQASEAAAPLAARRRTSLEEVDAFDEDVRPVRQPICQLRPMDVFGASNHAEILRAVVGVDVEKPTGVVDADIRQTARRAAIRAAPPWGWPSARTATPMR